MSGFAALFSLLLIQYVWILGQLVNNTSHLNLTPTTLENCDGHFLSFLAYYWLNNELEKKTQTTDRSINMKIITAALPDCFIIRCHPDLWTYDFIDLMRDQKYKVA